MQRCFSGYKKKYPGNPPPDSKPNPIPNLTLPLPLTPQVGGGGVLGGGIFLTPVFRNQASICDGALLVNKLNGSVFSQYKLHHRCSTVLYMCLWKYWNFQSEAKLEQIIAIVTTRSVSCFYCFIWLQNCYRINFIVTTLWIVKYYFL